MSDDFELTTYTEDECKNKTKSCSKKNTSSNKTSSKKLKRCSKTIDFVEELCGDKYCKTKKGEEDYDYTEQEFVGFELLDVDRW